MCFGFVLVWVCVGMEVGGVSGVEIGCFWFRGFGLGLVVFRGFLVVFVAGLVVFRVGEVGLWVLGGWHRCYWGVGVFFWCDFG